MEKILFTSESVTAVSYTHLDVYKRQVQYPVTDGEELHLFQVKEKTDNG